MTRAQYHDDSFKFLGIEPVFANLEQIRDREKTCGFRFPASVVEWYAIEGGYDFLNSAEEGNMSRGGKIVPISELGDIEPADSPIPHGGYLQIYRPGEGDFPIYVILNGADDPPVFSDASTRDEDDLLVPSFYKHDDRFSDFVLKWLVRGTEHGRS